jgi:Zn-dependent protease
MPLKASFSSPGVDDAGDMKFREWYRYRRLRAFGAPIYIHWSVFAIALGLVLISLDSVVHAVTVITCYLAIIMIHELGHAWFARRRHYEVIAIRIATFHGRCEHEAAEYEWDDIAIAWGGVLAQLAIAIPMLIVAAVFGRPNLGLFSHAVSMLGRTNLLIALFNLIPAAGFDGAKAWRVLPLARDWWISRRTTKRVLRKWTRR